MSIPIPLTVRLTTSRGSKSVTRELRDLQFRSLAPGGFASATISLDRPLAMQPDEIGYYGRLYVYDARSGKTVWEGRVEDPGRSVDDSGQVWQIAAIGPSGHVHDRAVPYIIVDSRMSTMIHVDNTKPGFETAVGPIPNSDPNQGIVLRLPQGITTNLNDGAAMSYQSMRAAGMKVARCAYTANAGGANGNWVVMTIYGTDVTVATGDTGDSITMTTAVGGSARNAVVVTDFSNGRNCIFFVLFQNAGGAVTAANDLHWASFQGVVTRAMLINTAGSDITTGYTNDYVLAHEVVNDLLGRLLTQYDGPGASVSTGSTFHITQLAYDDGVDAGKVLGDLMTFEPAYYWAAWESNTAGKYRFEWTPWPSSVRYEASTLDGYRSQGSADGLYNAVRVRYLDSLGVSQSERRTSSVAELTAAGLTREAPLDLGKEAGTQAQAQQAGDQFLADHAAALNAGSLTVARPILDRVQGRMVQPWEIRPGALIRVRGIQPRVNSLNATTKDGVTVFRIVGTEYRAASASVTLDLDSYPPDVARAVAALQGRLGNWRH